MGVKRRLVFLQLPRLDPDTKSPGENLMSAAACLHVALGRSAEGGEWIVLPTPREQDSSCDSRLADAICALKPDVIAATCYLWNIERTLAALRTLRRIMPALKVALGGPEVADENPLLPSAYADVYVVGEGESVFPDVLRFLRGGAAPDWEGVSWRTEGGSIMHGVRPRRVLPLRDLLPEPAHEVNRPDRFGMAYMETSRGCPMRCAFCSYGRHSVTTTCLPPAEVGERIRILRVRGAREIRLTDPTFNAHPLFPDVLDAMARENADGKIAFFVEIRADTLNDSQAAMLARAGVVEAEVGIQSLDPDVLRTIRRPPVGNKLFNGIDALLRHGIKPTLDFMYALPGQGRDDVDASIKLLLRYGDAIHPQLLPTLLLPGTELRTRAEELGLRAQKLPPYRVLATDRVSTAGLAELDEASARMFGGFDTPTARFAGIRLAGIFPKRIHLEVDALPVDIAELADSNAFSDRQAVIIRGNRMFERRKAISGFIAACVNAEPHILWQFVLEPDEEEPLDLLEYLAAGFPRHPEHWLDRLVATAGAKVSFARRLYVRLPKGGWRNDDWVAEADDLLAGYFH